MILPRMSHMVVPVSKENMVTQTSIMVSGFCTPYPAVWKDDGCVSYKTCTLWPDCHMVMLTARCKYTAIPPTGWFSDVVAGRSRLLKDEVTYKHCFDTTLDSNSISAR